MIVYTAVDDEAAASVCGVVAGVAVEATEQAAETARRTSTSATVDLARRPSLELLGERRY